jgi:hypothetical protein
MPGPRRNALGAVVLALALVAPPVAAMGVFPNCLDQLSKRTRTWSVCTHAYDRGARECRQLTAAMWNSMETCRRKGYSKAEIDTAMAEGAAAAGKPEKPKPPTTPAPAPKPGSSPIPGLDAPPADRDD